MPTKEQEGDLAQHLSPLLRPQQNPRYSNSVPSTPFQRPRRLSFGARSPSPTKHLRDGSPKSSHSQVENGTVRARARAPSFTGCRFETGMAFSRRRIPYSIGGDQLERAKVMPKKFLNGREEGTLSAGMRELYDRILPSKESDERRADFVQKLDRILNQRWPGSNIKIHMFGSSGNMLCTNDSDVDICITTSFRQLEKTCLLAEALAEHGMKRVVCVPHAKVPIVKFWDPQTELACDMNVNNTLALENTRMIKTYVQIDDRVRPLAMIVKHWTKQRILNDAALGGTLSSYAWICMILHFLQTRNPPILPSLHAQASQSSPLIDGKYAPFSDDIEHLRGFGKANKETLGDLLFQFFRRYAHDIDYEKNVISVREGRLISKEAKKWHLMQNNRLCVEEPFNTERNLGNTADDTSFRGIHLELRRAFDLVAEAKLDQCMEQYAFPPAEEKVWERPTPKPPPVLSRSRSQSQSSRGKGGFVGNRGGRHHSRGQSKGRRASSAAATNKYPFPPNGVVGYSDRPLVTQEQAIQAQIDQLKLHRQLFDEMQTLQRQEYELRLKQWQVQLQTDLAEQASNHGPPTGPQSAREQTRHNLMTGQVPMSAPLRSNQHFPPYMYSQVPGTPPPNVHTQPSSPSLRTIQPDLRRSMQRSSATDGSSSSNVRSHSQPARVMPPNVGLQHNVTPLPVNNQQLLHYQKLQRQLHREHIQQLMAESQGIYQFVDTNGNVVQRAPPVDPPFMDNPKEYAGYIINDSPPTQPYREEYNRRIPRIPQLQDLYPLGRVRGTRGGPSPIGRFGASRSPSPSPALPLRDRSFSLQSAFNRPSARQGFERVPGTGQPSRSGPIIVNGTDISPMPEAPPMLETSSRTTTVSEATSGSDEHPRDPYQTPNTAYIEPSYSGHYDESFAVDQAQHSYHDYQMTDRHRHAQPNTRSYMEPSSRRLSTQQAEAALRESGLKPMDRRTSNRPSLSIQFGELDYPQQPAKPETRRVQEPSRPTENANRNDTVPSASTNGQADKNQGPVPLLSPVREVRTPSPAGKGTDEATNLAKGSSIKRAAGKMDLHIPTWAELLRAKQEKGRSPHDGKMNGCLTPKMNGVSPSRTVPRASPERRPQGPYNLPNPSVARLNASQQLPNGWQQQAPRKHKRTKSRTELGQQGEPVPINESERKGG